MVAGWVGLFSYLESYLEATGPTQAKLAVTERRYRDQIRQTNQLALRLNEYKDAVASSGVKVDEKTNWNAPQRMIASSFSDPAVKMAPLTPSGKRQLEIAVNTFKRGDYARAIDLLEMFTQQFPEHPRAPEAVYYLVESYFYQQRLELSVKTIDHMITHYPETPYAALALLRLGTILEGRERIDEAADVYYSVINNYPGTVASSLAEKKLRGLNL